MSQTDSGQDYTPGQLREMDVEEAEWMLDEEQMKRWRKLRELDEQAAETREEWEEEAKTTAEVLVEADMGEFTTEASIYGNDLKVLVDLGQDQRQVIAAIEEEYSDLELGGEFELSDEEANDLEGMLAAFLEVMVYEWNGTRFDALDPDERRGVCEHAVSEWGLRSSIHAMLDILEAVHEEDEQAVERIQKFRGTPGGGRHRGASPNRHQNPD